ncbi:Phosphopentomutase [Gossypium arboreum]|uniref:Phosphopentomutase n=1 Tax=Gossypium arboreum TaxID=29729 RepID=A0A0B0MGR0_GOSAR|nr:Phosphopentomutase [Gossypium arboreum]
MPKSPQKWSFPNRTKLGLDKDTPTCEEVQAVLEPVKPTRACDLPV